MVHVGADMWSCTFASSVRPTRSSSRTPDNGTTGRPDHSLPGAISRTSFRPSPGLLVVLVSGWSSRLTVTPTQRVAIKLWLVQGVSLLTAAGDIDLLEW